MVTVEVRCPHLTSNRHIPLPLTPSRRVLSTREGRENPISSPLPRRERVGVRVKFPQLDTDSSSAILEAMFRTSRPIWRTTLSALPILALLLALTLAPALAQEEVTGNYYTIKYDSEGNELWNAIYDGGGWDYGYGAAVDSEGNAIVTGASEIWHVYDEDGEAAGIGDGSTTVFNLDHTPIIPESETIYLDGVVTTDYEIDYAGGAVTFTVAPGEGVIITADYDYEALNYDYYTIKYDSNGNKLWQVAYDSGGRDEGYGVAVDSENNIIVIGRASDDFCTIKYSPDGNELWDEPAIYDGGDADGANSVAIDSENNIIAAGYSKISHVYHKDGEVVGTGNGTTTVFNLKQPPITAESETIYLHGIVTTDYQINYTSGAVTFTVAPVEGVVITADYDYEELNLDYYTIKYDKDGNELWSNAYDQGHNDGALEVVMDSASNVIVTGGCGRWHDDNQDGEEDEEEVDSDYCTIKYDQHGNEVWDEPLFYDSRHADTAYGAAVDSQDNIIVSGSYSIQPEAEPGTVAFPLWHRYTTIKYGPEGSKIWKVTYDGDGQEVAYDVAVDSEDRVIVTGKVSDGQTWNYYTIKYDEDGEELWSATYDGGQWDSALDVAVDYQGNIIVTGSSQAFPLGVFCAHPDVTVTDQGISDDPENDPGTYDPENMPPEVTWEDAKGFYVQAEGPDGSYQFFITFETPIGSGFTLYKLPDWTEVPHTAVGANTIQVQLDIVGGVLDPAFVLAKQVADNGLPTDGGGFPTGAIVGIAIGGCAAIALAYYYLVYPREKPLPRGERRRRAAKQRKQTKR